MICETLRDVLVDLAQRGKLIRVLKTVDLTWELVCLVKWMFQAVEEQNRCRMGKLGVQFEMFRGFPVKATDRIIGEPCLITTHWNVSNRQSSPY